MSQSGQALLHHSHLASQPHLGTTKKQHLIGPRQPFLDDQYRLGSRLTTVTGSYVPRERESVSLNTLSVQRHDGVQMSSQVFTPTDDASGQGIDVLMTHTLYNFSRMSPRWLRSVRDRPFCPIGFLPV